VIYSVCALHFTSTPTTGYADFTITAKSKKQRQKAAKALRKQAALNPEALAPKIPIYEQSVDLPAGDGTVEGAVEAGEARGELNKAMREKRRKSIKEDNFLRSMG
jgi:large subunit ribosomal protein L54